ncbi:MAG TPA: SsrA-binding protein [Clostridiales bacterium]|nr:MAG: SsrA-binding protein [Clostridiales bacterium GWD2_32_19]HCC07285.1 SsrA-binding protein [Clostridiales bacterium]
MESKTIAQNKKAYYDYFIEQTFEAGLVLAGTEVKSMRMGNCSIKESHIRVDKGEVYIYNMNIKPYEKGNIFNKDPVRTRKLLLSKKEINKLIGTSKLTGYTIVPTRVYLKKCYVKIEIAIAKGKKLYDKRDTIAKRDSEKRIKQAMSEKNSY